MTAERTLQLTSRYQAITGAIMLAACAALVPKLVVGTATGTLVMAANFALLKTLVGRLLVKGGSHKTLFAMGLIFKFIAVATVLAFLALSARVDPAGLGLGLGSLFVAIGLSLAHSIFLAPQARGS